MLTPCLRDAFGTSAFQVLSKVKPLNSAAVEELSGPVFESTISTHDSHVSHAVRTVDGPRQRTLCYLGELNGSAQARWLKSVEVFNEQGEAGGGID
jgi:hypothetical protein